MIEKNFHNSQIFDFETPDFESVELQPVSKDYLKILLFNLSILFVIFLGAVLSGIFLTRDVLPDELKWSVIATLSVIFVFSFINIILGFKFRKYAVREHDLMYQQGLIKRSIIIIPFNRIQHIKVEQGWLSKILKLKSVSVFTAGSHGGDITIKGLPEIEAELINQFIGQKVSQTKNAAVEQE
jgi:membrane protein YdbS with pleckstrin-like domain